MGHARLAPVALVVLASCGRLEYDPSLDGGVTPLDTSSDTRSTTDAPADASIADAGADASADAPGDRDRDGVVDAVDNCPSTPNPSQHDEDGHTVGDGCDGCPHLADPLQPDADGDGVDDGCDPEADEDNDIVSFLPFDGTPLPAAWRFDVEPGVPLTQRFEDDELVLGVPGSRLGALLATAPADESCLVATEAVLDVIEPVGFGPVRNFSIVDHFVPPLGMEDGVFAGPLDEIDDPADANLRILVLEDGGNLGSINFPEPSYGAVLATGIPYDLVYTRRGPVREARTTQPIAITTSGTRAGAGGDIGLRIRGITARFRYLIVID